MPRFALSQLLMGVTFIAIVLVLAQSESGGIRYTIIESLSFTPDDTQIAVTKLNARDAHAHLKHYKYDLARTISWLNVSDGAIGRQIHQDFKSGNCGPAFHLWQVGRTSVLCNPSTGSVTMSAFGGGEVTFNVETTKPSALGLKHRAFNIAYSKSGRLLAASGMDELTVFNTVDTTAISRFQTSDLPFQGGSLIAFSNNESRLIQVGRAGLHVWDIHTSTRLSTVIPGSEPRVNAIAVTSDDNVIVCTDDWVRRYDFTGQIVATLSEKGASSCSISHGDERLAIFSEDGLRFYDLKTNRVLNGLSFGGVTALAMSSTGEILAVGDCTGRVTLIDTATSAIRSHSTPHGRYRSPWTLPSAFLLVWIFVAYQMFRRG